MVGSHCKYSVFFVFTIRSGLLFQPQAPVIFLLSHWLLKCFLENRAKWSRKIILQVLRSLLLVSGFGLSLSSQDKPLHPRRNHWYSAPLPFSLRQRCRGINSWFFLIDPLACPDPPEVKIRKHLHNDLETCCDLAQLRQTWDSKSTSLGLDTIANCNQPALSALSGILDNRVPIREGSLEGGRHVEV